MKGPQRNACNGNEVSSQPPIDLEETNTGEVPQNQQEGQSRTQEAPSEGQSSQPPPDGGTIPREEQEDPPPPPEEAEEPNEMQSETPGGDTQNSEVQPSSQVDNDQPEEIPNGNEDSSQQPIDLEETITGEVPQNQLEGQSRTEQAPEHLPPPVAEEEDLPQEMEIDPPQPPAQEDAPQEMDLPQLPVQDDAQELQPPTEDQRQEVTQESQAGASRPPPQPPAVPLQPAVDTHQESPAAPRHHPAAEEIPPVNLAPEDFIPGIPLGEMLGPDDPRIQVTNNNGNSNLPDSNTANNDTDHMRIVVWNSYGKICDIFENPEKAFHRMYGLLLIQPFREIDDVIYNCRQNSCRIRYMLDDYYYSFGGSLDVKYGKLSFEAASICSFFEVGYDPDKDFSQLELNGYQAVDPPGEGNCLFYTILWAEKNRGMDINLPKTTTERYLEVISLRRKLRSKLERMDSVTDWKFEIDEENGAEYLQAERAFTLDSIYVIGVNYQRIRDETDYHAAAHNVPRLYGLYHNIRVVVVYLRFDKIKINVDDNDNTAQPATAQPDTVPFWRTEIHDYRPNVPGGYKFYSTKGLYRIPDEDFNYRDTVELLHVVLNKTENHFMWLKRLKKPVGVHVTTDDDQRFIGTEIFPIGVDDEESNTEPRQPEGPLEVDDAFIQEVQVLDLENENDSDVEVELEEQTNQKKELAKLKVKGIVSNQDAKKKLEYAIVYKYQKISRMTFVASRIFAHWSTDLHSHQHASEPMKDLKGIATKSLFMNLFVGPNGMYNTREFGITRESHPALKRHLPQLSELDFGILYDWAIKNGKCCKKRGETAVRINLGTSHTNRQSKIPRKAWILLRVPPSIDIPDMPKEVRAILAILMDTLSEIILEQNPTFNQHSEHIRENFLNPFNTSMGCTKNMFTSYTLLFADVALIVTKGSEFHVDVCNGHEFPNNIFGNLTIHLGSEAPNEKVLRMSILGYGRVSTEHHERSETACKDLKNALKAQSEKICQSYTDFSGPIVNYTPGIRETVPENFKVTPTASFSNPERLCFPQDPPDLYNKYVQRQNELPMKEIPKHNLKNGSLYYYKLARGYAPEIEWSPILNLLSRYLDYQMFNKKDTPFYLHIYAYALCQGCDAQLFLSSREIMDPFEGDGNPVAPILPAALVRLLSMQHSLNWGKIALRIKGFEFRHRCTTILTWKEFIEDDQKMSGFVAAIERFCKEIQSKPMKLEEYYKSVLELALASPGIHPFFLQDVGIHLALLGIVKKNVKNTFYRLPIKDPSNCYIEEVRSILKLPGYDQETQGARFTAMFQNEIRTELSKIRQKRLKVEGIWADLLKEMGLALKWNSVGTAVRSMSTYLGIEDRAYWIERYYRVIQDVRDAGDNSFRNSEIYDLALAPMDMYWLFPKEGEKGSYSAMVKRSFDNATPGDFIWKAVSFDKNESKYHPSRQEQA